MCDPNFISFHAVNSGATLFFQTCCIVVVRPAWTLMNPFEDEIRNQTNSTTQGTAGMNPFEDEVVKSSNPFDGAVNNSRPFEKSKF